MIQIPEGRSGDWIVSRFTVTQSESNSSRLRAALHNYRGYVPAGTYTKLTSQGGIVMSDTPDELRDLGSLKYRCANYRAGNVLITGLGLGCAVQYALESPRAKKVQIVEISPDVIRLVGPTLQEAFGERLEIINADAINWKPVDGTHYVAVWHDIWDDICGDNWPEMNRLLRRYAKRTDWQRCWCQTETKQRACTA